MTKRVLAVAIIRAFITAALFGSAACGQTPSANADSPSENVVVIDTDGGPQSFEIELADTDESRTIGLMHRESLPENAGMLFDFGPEPKPISMWMKNTLIPLDMAFIDASGRIVRIEAMTTPRSLTSIPSGGPALAVLEVNGGRLEALGVEVGDQVRHPLFEQ